MLPPSRGWRLLALSTLLVLGGAQSDGPSNVPTADAFSRRSEGRTVVIGDYIYYEGGEVSERGFTSPSRLRNPVNATMSIDLSTSWRIEDVVINEISRSASVKSKSRPALLVDPSGDSFYIWGGSNAANLGDLALRKFTADGRGGGSWSEETDLANRPVFEQLDRVQGAAHVSTPTRAFVVGGVSSKGTSLQPKDIITGYVAFDFDDKSWSQNDTADYSSDGSLFGATMTYVPGFGDNGVVVMLGGTFDGAKQYLDFGTVHLLDPVTREWHQQAATGLKPSKRALHCATGVAGPNGTYDIFVYGGEIRGDGSSYGDMYALSLPGFRWTRLAPDRRAPERRDHACETVGRRQMLSWGGINTGDGRMWGTKDSFPHGIGIFDMTALQWRDSYDADADAYEPHESIRRWYDEGGMSTVNWTSDAVEAMFASTTPPSSNDGEDKPTSGGEKEEDGGGSVSPGVIAGIVIGAVAGLALIGGLVWFLLRRKKRKHTPSGPAPDVSYTPAQTDQYFAQPKAYGYQPELDGRSPPSEMPDSHVYRAEAASVAVPAEMADTSMARR